MRPVEIVIYEEYEQLLRESGRRWVFITGFPGFGYVGTIATRYLAGKTASVKIGDIVTKYMPDFVAVEDYGVMTPYEIFLAEDKGLLIVVNNALPSTPERVPYALTLADWFKKVNGSKAIMAGGLNVKLREGGESFRWVSNAEHEWSFKEPVLSRGNYIVGPLATLYAIFTLRKIPTLLLLPYTEPGKYDPSAAAVFIRKLNEILGIDVSVDDLIEYSKLVAYAETLMEEVGKREDRGPKLYM
ncbi:MAG: PAC2 family protein [Zestosphaera sp.]